MADQVKLSIAMRAGIASGIPSCVGRTYDLDTDGRPTAACALGFVIIGIYGIDGIKGRMAFEFETPIGKMLVCYCGYKVYANRMAIHWNDQHNKMPAEVADMLEAAGE